MIAVAAQIRELPPRPAPAVKLLPYQEAAIRRPDRFTWNNWSRQTGKSFTFTLRRILRGLCRRRDQLLLSAGERQSRELLRKVQAHCCVLGIACEMRGLPFLEQVRFSKLEARLPGGVRILALPANPMTARGFTADVFLDEFAMHRDDRAIWAALLPTLLRGDGELDVASTPRGRDNMFHRLADNPRFTHSTLTLRDAVAQGLPVDECEIRQAMDDERLFRQEFLCEFDGDEDAWLAHDLIVACSDPALAKAPDQPLLESREAELYLGVDVGRLRDLTVLWLWQRQGEHFVTRGVIELARRPFAEQRRAIDDLLGHRSVRRVCIDAGGIGMSLSEELVTAYGADRVEAVNITPIVQSELANRVRRLAEERRVHVPVDEAIHNDWHRLQRVVTSSGHVRFRAARTADGHADRFWAAALGLHAAADPAPGRAEFLFAEPLRFTRNGSW